MALPTSTELLALDVADAGAPFVALVLTTGTDPDPVDQGAPFAGADAGTGTPPALTGASSQSLPALLGSGTGSQTGASMNESALVLPSLSGSGTGSQAETPMNESALVLPSLSGTGTGNAGEARGTSQAFAPLLIATGTGLPGPLGRSALALAALAGAGTGAPGALGRSAQALSPISGSGTQASHSAAALPALTGTGSGQVGVKGGSVLDLPRLAAASAGQGPVSGQSAAALPALTAQGHGFVRAAGASTATLSRLLVASHGLTGSVGRSTLALPLVATTASGHVQVVGSSTVTLPRLDAVPTAIQPAPLPATGTAYALQTRGGALTRYPHLPFRALAKAHGVYLAAGPGGLFVLGGDTDAGAAIAAAVKTGLTDFEDPHLKRIEALYVHYRTNGELTLTAMADDTTAYDYPVVPHGSEALNSTRVKIGKGLSGIYWQFGIENVDGADFELDALEVAPRLDSRRLG